MKSEILKRWESAPNYMGEDFSDYFIVTSFNRDSNVYEIANFIGIANHLMDIEDESDSGWKIARFGHWMHGYLYCIFVHKDSHLIAECEEIALSLSEYPVFDDDVLAECESLIEEELSEIEDTETRMQMLIEAPASLICESLLKPYL